MREVMDGMDPMTVQVDRVKLLKTLKANLEKHRKDYAEAVEGYKAQAFERLSKLSAKVGVEINESFDRIRKQIDRFDPNDTDAIRDTVVLIHTASFNLKVPQDHSRAYAVAIQQAEWDTREVVPLTQSQFQAFVMDDWEWQTEFQLTKNMYSNNKR